MAWWVAWKSRPLRSPWPPRPPARPPTCDPIHFSTPPPPPQTHSVAGKSIHVVFAPSSGKEKDTAKLLADYLTVSTTAPTDLGIEPEVLEMAWELCSETEAKDFSPKSILSVIDESLYKTSVDQYKAFRLLTSDLGKVFFKTLSGNRFEAKGEKAVLASKEQWCDERSKRGSDQDW